MGLRSKDMGKRRGSETSSIGDARARARLLLESMFSSSLTRARVATLDNRSEIEELRDTVQRLDRRLDKLVA